MTYEEWIDKNYPTKESALNQCNKACKKMLEAFNPLFDFFTMSQAKQNLFIQVGLCNGIYHCWLIDADKNIIDPTAKQFDGLLSYKLIADRFLDKSEVELSTGALFLNANTI